jgi:phosphoglycolate phosphatase
MKPLLVFDLDGTLADSAPDLLGTLNVILRREGLAPVPLEAARALLGAGARALIARGFAQEGRVLGPDRLEQLFRDFIVHYEAHIADGSQLYPGVLAALDRLGDAGYPLAVCTNKLEHAALLLLRALGVEARFRAICGQDTFGVAKPNPHIFKQTVARAGGAADAIMIGDSRTDIDTARAAGVPVIAVDFGYTDVPIEVLKPDRVIGHFDELWDAVQAVEQMKAGALKSPVAPLV